jgi:hypothetical protein
LASAHFRVDEGAQNRGEKSMTARIWLDSRSALMLFGAVLTFAVPLFSTPLFSTSLSSMLLSVARVAQLEMTPIGADMTAATKPGRTTTPGARATPVGQLHSSTPDFVEIRVAAETRERPRELVDARDSPLDESRYHPGRAYDFPWDRDPLFGWTRHSLATTGLVLGCVRCFTQNGGGTRRRLAQTRK